MIDDVVACILFLVIMYLGWIVLLGVLELATRIYG